MLTRDFKDLLRLLNSNGVEYLLIGGHAFGVHAEPRTTKELDIFIRSNPESARAIFRALAQFGAPLGGMTEADFVDGTTFQLGLPPNRIDILQTISGINFEEAWRNRVVGLIDGEIPAHVISRDDLIKNKLASGREQDLLDVKVLRRAALAVPDDSKK